MKGKLAVLAVVGILGLALIGLSYAVSGPVATVTKSTTTTSTAYTTTSGTATVSGATVDEILKVYFITTTSTVNSATMTYIDNVTTTTTIDCPQAPYC